MPLLPRRQSTKPNLNPFRFGDVASGEYFTDRAREIEAVLGDVRSGQNLLLLAPRRFGKTSLLVAVMEQLRRENVSVAYADLLRVTTKAEFAEVLATALYAGLEPPVGRLAHRAADFFHDLTLRPKVTINADGTPSLELAPGAEERDVDATLEQLLAMPGKIATQRRRRVVLVLDEFQEIVEIAPDLPRRLRAVFQFQPEVAHVYLGSRQHLLQRVFTDANQPLYNSARVMALGPIAPADFGAFIRQRFAASGKTIADAAVAALLDATSGHPHDTQKLCYFTWLGTPDRGEATPDTVADAIDQILETDTARFTQIWDDLTPTQRRVLEAVAQAERPVNPLTEAFRRAHRLGTYATVDRALSALIERSHLERAGRDTYFVPDVFLRLWLRATPGSPA